MYFELSIYAKVTILPPSQKQSEMAYGEHSLTGLKISNGVLLNWPSRSLAFMLFMEASNKGEFYSCSIILVWALYSDGKVQVLSDLNHIWLPPKILNGCKKPAIITRKDIASATNLILTQYIYYIRCPVCWSH